MIPLPSGKSSGKLAHLKVDRPLRGKGTTQTQYYSLRQRHSAKGKAKDDSSTQLIGMASGNDILTHEAGGLEDAGNEEMDSLQVMVPTGDAGQYEYCEWSWSGCV